MKKQLLIALSFIFFFSLIFSYTNVLALEITEQTDNVSIENDNNDEKERENVEIILSEETEEETINEEIINKDEEPINDANVSENEIDTIHEEIYNQNKALVIVTKVDENKNPLSGAVLQILDSSGNVVDEWTSDGTEHEVMLPDGTYTLHETKAPEGYDLAADKEFTIKIEIPNIDAGVDFSDTPCEHYGGTPLYYVEIEGEKYEVYCINQDWETPDENSIYDGEVLNSSDIKDYTKQTVYTDAHQNKEKIDISDQSLSSQELYDKILDIIYHRNKATNDFSDLTEAEIRYVTESALKNYTNAGLTRVQRVTLSNAPENYENFDYYITEDNKYVWYLYPWYRSFVYDPSQPLGKDIYRTDLGNGDAFGNLVRHWSSAHNGKNSEEVRQKIARYYELYKYLISDSDNHPSGMHLYIYSTNNQSTDSSGFNFDEGNYQNLLGITGYLESVKEQEQKIELVNNYSTEITKVNVKKIWEDYDDADKVRPKEITVYLLANKNVINQIKLSEENDWAYTFDNLLMYEKGNKIIYTILEEEIELYDTFITGSVEKGFIITNYYSPKGGDDIPPENIPQTGDNIYLSIIIFISSLIGILCLLKFKTKNM